MLLHYSFRIYKIDKACKMVQNVLYNTNLIFNFKTYDLDINTITNKVKKVLKDN